MVNIVATVCLLKTSDKQQFFKILDKIEELLHPYNNEPNILQTLLTWFMHYLHTHGIINTIPEIEEHLSNVQEVQTMLYTTLQEIKEDYKKEGYAEGH